MNNRSYLASIFSLFILGSCSSSYKYQPVKENNSVKYSHLSQNNSKKVIGNRKTPPSESSQIGDSFVNKAKKYVLTRVVNDVDLSDPGDSQDNILNNSYSGHYKVGKPYQVKGVVYNPEEYEGYEEVGQASWYGSDFDGKSTANGETYNMEDLTAAHRTLPLPSIIKVTNLANGKSVKVRVNDRGPFSNSRVIDVSKKTADTLGFRSKGLANVKIEFLREDTEQLLADLKLKN